MKKYALLQKAYNFTEFEQNGKQLIEQLATYLNRQQLSASKANNWQAPDKELDYWKNYEFRDLNSFVDDLLDHSIHVHNPKYMGHQVSVSAPLSVLSNIIIGLLNNGMAVYEMGKAANAIEKCVVELFCEKVGYDDNSSGQPMMMFVLWVKVGEYTYRITAFGSKSYEEDLLLSTKSIKELTKEEKNQFK